MPPKALITLGKKYGVSAERVERIWDESKESCKKQYGYREGSTELYQCAMGLTRKRLEMRKDSKFDIVQQLDKTILPRIYVENLHPDLFGIQVYVDGKSIVYILPEDLYQVMSDLSFGDKLTEKQLDLLERKSKKKIIVKEKKPKVKKIADTFRGKPWL